MNRRAGISWICLALAITCLLVSSTTVRAAKSGPGASATVLTLRPLTHFALGEPVTILAKLTSTSGQPIVGQHLHLFVDGVGQRDVLTGKGGVAIVSARHSPLAGQHNAEIVFLGSKRFRSSLVSTTLVVDPEELEVKTVPPLAGVRFSLNQTQFVSGQDGVARITVKSAGNFFLRMLSVKGVKPDIRAVFHRWQDDSYLTSRRVKLPLKHPLGAGFDVSYRTGQTFVDLFGHRVDLKRISALTIKGSDGVIHTFKDGRPSWLLAGRVVRRQNGLEETNIQYSVLSVVMDGANVVNQKQQRFYVQQNGNWKIHLLLYSATFSARDALFGFPIGSGIRVKYPNGLVKVLAFGSHSHLKVGSLVRGLYQVGVTGALGIAPSTPLALTQNQDVQLLVISYLDIAVTVVLVSLLVFGLLFIGRPQLLSALRSVSLRQRRGAAPRRMPTPVRWLAKGQRHGPFPDTSGSTKMVLLSLALFGVSAGALLYHWSASLAASRPLQQRTGPSRGGAGSRPVPLPRIYAVSPRGRYPSQAAGHLSFCWRTKLVGQQFDLYVVVGTADLHRTLTPSTVTTRPHGLLCTTQALAPGASYGWRLTENVPGSAENWSSWQFFSVAEVRSRRPTVRIAQESAGIKRSYGALLLQPPVVPTPTSLPTYRQPRGSQPVQAPVVQSQLAQPQRVQAPTNPQPAQQPVYRPPVKQPGQLSPAPKTAPQPAPQPPPQPAPQPAVQPPQPVPTPAVIACPTPPNCG